MSIERLLINEPPMQVLPTLAKAIGLNEAILLQQLHYMLRISNQERDGRRWVYNTASEWAQVFPFWSESTIRRILANLRKQGLIIATDAYNQMRIDKTLWYTIDYDALDNLPITNDENETPSAQNDHSSCSEWADGCGQNEQMDVVKMSRPITKELLKEKDIISPQAAPAEMPEQPQLFGVGHRSVRTEKRKPKKKSAAYVNPETGVSTNDITNAYLEIAESYEPGVIVNMGETNRWAKVLAERGWRPDHVRECYAAMRADPYWRDKTIRLGKLAEMIASRVSRDGERRRKRPTGLAGVQDLDAI